MALVSMSPEQVAQEVAPHVENFFIYLDGGHWTLEHAHAVLRENRLGLLETAGLAQAIACFQCSPKEMAARGAQFVGMSDDDEPMAVYRGVSL